MNDYIFEMPIYDGRMKEWRVLNLYTNTFYSQSHVSRDAASQSIEHNTERAGKTVIRILHYSEIAQHLSDKKETYSLFGDFVQKQSGKTLDEIFTILSDAFDTTQWDEFSSMVKKGMNDKGVFHFKTFVGHDEPNAEIWITKE